MSDAIFIASITAIGPVVAVAISGVMNYRLGTKTHEIVNSQRTVMVDQIDGLKAEVLRLQSRLDALIK